jgi:hypothetical protein
MWEKQSASENKEEYNYKTVQRHNAIQNEALNQFAESRISDRIIDYKETRRNNKDIIKDYFETDRGQDEEEAYNRDLVMLYSKNMANYLEKMNKKNKRQESMNLSMVGERAKNEEAEIFESAMKHKLSLEDLKFYPGSVKGPEPEDDPAFYAFWLKNSQPKVLQYLEKKRDKDDTNMSEDGVYSGTKELFEEVKITTDRVTCNKVTQEEAGERPYDDMDHYNEKEIMDDYYLDGSNIVFLS